jgi:hypothetical protein
MAVTKEGRSMGFFTRLFGSGESSKGSPGISMTRGSNETDGIWQRLEHEGLIAQTTHKVLRDYGTVLETVNEQRDGVTIGLHPASKLPYPKEVIRAAFAIAFEQMQRHGWQEWNNTPRNVLEIAATSLDIHFAPDQEAPDDPLENFVAFNNRQQERYSETQLNLHTPFKVKPEGWDRLLEIAGISKDIRDTLVKQVRETW